MDSIPYAVAPGPATWGLRGTGRPWFLAAAAATLVLVVAAYVGWQRLHHVGLPQTSSVGPWPRFVDHRPLEVVTTVHWRKVSELSTRPQFLMDDRLWQRMHFEDWDLLPPQVRARGLDHMWARYGALVTATHAWPDMDARDWDRIPQPVRAMVFVSMIEHWVEFYGVGGSFDLPRQDVLRTIKAIAMSESWFDHRASATNTDGSVDLGLGGASGFARRTIRRWYEDGRCDFTMDDADYYDPWRSTRWLAFWFEVMLQEARGDLSLAIRAWNWGIGRASAGEGATYLAAVERRRSRFFEGPSRSPTWRRLSALRHAQQGTARLETMHLPLDGPVISPMGAAPPRRSTTASSRGRMSGADSRGHRVLAPAVP